jgi:hypothetical protein
MSNLLWRMTEHKNALAAPIAVSHVNAWHGHIPFAFFITQALQPRVFVELGVHMGDSYLAFCQGIRDSGKVGRAYGVDLWTGDAHSGPYEENVYETLWKYNQPTFGSFSTLMRMAFDDAAHSFGPEIDLLHIDGFHTYEAVAHDLEVWLPKMSRRGVILLHDTVVKFADFGVWKKWAELKEANPCFDFFHSNGLGVMIAGDDPPELIAGICRANKEPEGEWIRRYFELLAERLNSDGPN